MYYTATSPSKTKNKIFVYGPEETGEAIHFVKLVIHTENYCRQKSCINITPILTIQGYQTFSMYKNYYKMYYNKIGPIFPTTITVELLQIIKMAQQHTPVPLSSSPRGRQRHG